MSNNDIPTPNGWHWVITPEQVEKIKQYDQETINKVYFDNYNKFLKMAKRYCKCKDYNNILQDCLQQIYLDLPKYKYDNAQTLFWSIIKTFSNSSLISWSVVASIDQDVDKGEKDGEPTTLLNFVGVDVFAKYEKYVNETRRFLQLLDQQRFTNCQKDKLCAIGFDTTYAKGLYEAEKQYIYKLCY